MVAMWVRHSVEFRGGKESLLERPLVLAGSHDPLLEWSLRESSSGIATFFDGSLDGFERIASAQAIAAGVHVYEPEGDDWNRFHVENRLPGMAVVLVEWAKRWQGLVLPPGNPDSIASVRDLAGLSFIPRQPNAGSHVLFEHLLTQGGMDTTSLSMVSPPARSETDVALAVADGKARVGFAVETVAHQLRLEFVPLLEERYDLVVWRRDYFQPPMQRFLAFSRTAAFAKRAHELGGYDVSNHGTIHYNGP
jgi:molybdate-binding protein